jgi:Uma2 family endonuclease
MRHELIRGEVVSMCLPGPRHGKITLKIGRLIGNFVDDQDLGEVYAAETGFLIDRDPDTVRGADVAFGRGDRIPSIGNPDSYFPFAPDLAVEVLSPNDTMTEVEAKVHAWLDAGSRMVWVVDPKNRSITVYRQGKEPVTLGGDEELDGGDVLPGFKCRVADCFK